MPFEFSEETRRLLDFLSRQQAFSQQDPTQDPMAVLGDMQYIEGDKVINDGGAGQGYQIPIANGANTNAAWQEASQQQPRVVTESRPATPEEYARVDHSPALEEIKEQLRRQVAAKFTAQAPPQQTSDEIVASAINQAFPQQQAQPTSQPQSSPAQQAPARQEQASGTDLVNRAVEPAIPQTPSRLLPPAPNTVQHNYRQQIIATKLLYDDAERRYNAAQTPEEKQAALVEMQSLNQRANDLRGIANETGVDLTGYGEGVSLKDAQRNLESQKAKDFMRMYTGRYSMTSDQFYESEYDRQIMSGASPDTAARRAARSAREYKAQRVAYLNGMYNNYGLTNGQVTNQLGMQILTELAGEAPNRTNAYGTAYALPKDEYKNANEIAQLVLTNNNARDNMVWKTYLQNWLDENNARRSRETYATNKGVDQRFKIEDEKRAEDKEEQAYQKKTRRLEWIADRYGITGKAKNALVLAGLGIKMPEDASEAKSEKLLMDTLRHRAEEIRKQREAIVKQYKDNTGAGEIPPEAADQIARLDEDWDSINNAIMAITGLRGNVDEYSETDEEANIASIAKLIQAGQKAKKSDAEIFNAVRKFVPSDRTDRFVQSLIEKAIGKIR